MKTIRMCMINADSTEEGILNTIERLDQIAKNSAKSKYFPKLQRKPPHRRRVYD